MMSNNNNKEMIFSYQKENQEENVMKEIAGDYLIKETIGEGTFSKVKLGINIYTGQKVAIKILNKIKLIEEEGITRVLREIKISSELNHPNIIKIFKILEDNKYFLVVMEYCEDGELFNYIVKKNKLTERESAYFYYQLINAVEYLHSKGICHRDLKPENILLGENHLIKLIDFGLSTYIDDDKLLITPCGSPCYAAPEMIIGEQYNGTNTDIWATGIILYAMLCGYLPFDNEENDIHNDLLFNKILSGRIEYPYFLSDLALDLLMKILVHNPEKRITIKEIKKHPFYLIGKKIFEDLQKTLHSTESEICEKKSDNNNNENNENNSKNIYSKNNKEEKNENKNISKRKYPNERKQIVTTSNDSNNTTNLTSMNKKTKEILNNNHCVTTYSNNVISKTEGLVPINSKLITSFKDNINLKQNFNVNYGKSDNKENFLLTPKYDKEKVKRSEILKNITALLPNREINSNKKEMSWDYPYNINKKIQNQNKESKSKSPNKSPILKIKVYNSLKKNKHNELVRNVFFNNTAIDKNKSNIKMNDKLIINLKSGGEAKGNKSSLLRINHKLKNLGKRLQFLSPLRIPNVRLNTDDIFPLINSPKNHYNLSTSNEKVLKIKNDGFYSLKKNINNIENMKIKESLKCFYNKKYNIKFPSIKIK